LLLSGGPEEIIADIAGVDEESAALLENISKLIRA
jgi:hypothetical protein